MRFLSVLSLIALFPLVGCSPDPKPLIIKELASQGYDNVQFSSMGASAGAFAFTADKGNQACRGTAAVIGSGSDPLVDLTLDCPKPKAQEAPRVVEDPYKKLSEECEAGDAKRCFELGDKLVNGNVTARDLPRARKVHQGACDKEHMGACVQLGWLFLKGLGGAQDVDRAEEIFQATCDGGYMDGCARLARVSFVAGAYKTARKGFEKACDGGSHLGCVGFASMLKRGYGGKKDEKKAYKHFESACEAGIYEGCANLGIMYLKGQGVPQSNDRARSYLEVACKENERIACEHLKELGD